MAKNMARIEDGLVINIEWCSDKQAQTERLISLADRPVAIGDAYADGVFSRDGEPVLTYAERLEAEVAEYDAVLTEIETALGVNV